MSETKILLEKNRSIDSDNITEKISVNLENKTKMLNNDKLVDNMSLYTLYNTERDSCQKYRLIFTVNPICSNILFNMKSEILYKEGHWSVQNITVNGASKSNCAGNAINTTSTINHLQAIRDTEYSHEDLGGFTYHCGLDIMNNHMIRNDGFTHIGKYNQNTAGKRGSVFNTFKDYLVDNDGSIVSEKIYGSTNDIDRHLYDADNLMTLKNTFLYKCKEQNGWFGFINQSSINIPNVELSGGTKITINRPMMNNKPCEFIDFYPDRSLYSFVPKYNKYRNRIEKNWDYTIVYPYDSDTNKLNKICGGWNGAIAFKYKKVKSSSKDLLECNCYFKHTLKVGDYVKLYYRISSNQYSTSNVLVESLGDRNGQRKDSVFNIDYDVVKDIIGNISEHKMYYKKMSNGIECNYYFRKFKSIETPESKLASDVNKIAFGRNIYDDELAQIVYTDDIDLTGLVDNNGRPLTELYLAIVKRNAGYKEWYNNNNFGSETVEFSHCFGEVTSGLDFSSMGVDKEPRDYNVHYLTNARPSGGNNPRSKINTKNVWGDCLKSGATTLESEITINNSEFYGDVVELDLYKCKESIIGTTYFRFNTAQRETYNENYRDIVEDVIIRDDLDVVKTGETAGFSSTTYYRNSSEDTQHVYDPGHVHSDLFYGNIFPEGYFYKPFYRIPVRTENSTASFATAKNINYDTTTGITFEDTEEDYLTDISLALPTPNNKYKIGQTIGIYDIKTNDTIIGYIKEVKVNDKNIVTGITSEFSNKDFERASKIQTVGDEDFEAMFKGGSGVERRYYAFWSETNIPKYAKLCKERSRFVWRELVAPSKLTSNDELYDTPFMNGSFYQNINVNLFLRRQDPQGDYGLSKPKNASGQNELQTFRANTEVKKIDVSNIITSLNNDKLCY